MPPDLDEFRESEEQMIDRADAQRKAEKESGDDLLARLRVVCGYDKLLAEAADEIERLRDEVKFYANRDNWWSGFARNQPRKGPANDDGKHARAALAATEVTR